MRLAFMLFNLLLVAGISAQTFSLNSIPAEVLSVSGSSSLHDWSVDATEMNGLLQELSMTDRKLTIDAFEMSIPVSSLDGGKPAMKNKLQKALMEDDYPNIVFQVEEQLVIDIKDDIEDVVPGILTIAGKTKSIDLALDVSIANDVITLTGNENMKMTDFDISPPTALFGQIKTRDDIVVSFELSYKQINQ